VHRPGRSRQLCSIQSIGNRLRYSSSGRDTPIWRRGPGRINAAVMAVYISACTVPYSVPLPLPERRGPQRSGIALGLSVLYLYSRHVIDLAAYNSDIGHHGVVCNHLCSVYGPAGPSFGPRAFGPFLGGVLRRALLLQPILQ